VNPSFRSAYGQKSPKQLEGRVLWTLDMKENPCVRLLYVTGRINQELLVKNEYLAAENRILRAPQKLCDIL
jgi:hypothetical protein